MLDETVIYKGKALSVGEINQLMRNGTEAFLSVSAKGKTVAIWEELKLVYQ